MVQKDREKIENIVRDRRWAHDKLTDSGSGVYQAFLKMEAAAYSGKALSKMTKELIAIGISLVLNCESCLEWHIHQALGSGASKDEILEAIEVGIEMGGGPATVSSRFALKVLEYYSESK
ncbi:MAG: carboxymuconolactone decarboxylase family protein [Spirochaetaceae bacterium]|nr:MAG: carboxymuconolactone decarboxylase family protein [Spirochaetaceae bacterium]